MSKKQIKESQIKLLWGESGSRCAICKVKLVKTNRDGGKYQVGEQAHIEGENPGSARYNLNMTDEERADYENLILLCPTDHTIIDKDEDDYTVSKLKQIKKDHEKWVNDSLRSFLPEITFAELEVIIKYLSDTSITAVDNLKTIIPPAEKIKKNNLSPGVETLITMGMVQVRLVEKYLNRNPDIQFSGRLKTGFVNQYIALKQEGLDSDALFYELLDFASNYSADFKEKAAGLSVLSYFFERCEVFET